MTKDSRSPRDAPNAFEKARRPDGPAVPGEDPGKRTNEERNDPEREPGTADGQPRDHPAQI